MSDDLEELKRMSNPAYKVAEQLDTSNEILSNVVTHLENNQAVLVKILAVIDGDEKNNHEKQSVRQLLKSISKTVHCFKTEHRTHRDWGKKVTIFTLSLAVVALGVEVVTKGEVPVFTIAWQYVKGVLL